MLEDIERTDISGLKEFAKYGDKFTQVKVEPSTGRYLYKRVSPEGVVSWEVVIPKKRKNPDGSVVHTYPGSESWGTNGFTVVENIHRDAITKFLLTSPDLSPATRYEFKKTLPVPKKNNLWL